MRGGISSDLGKEMLPIAGADEVDCRRDLTESDTGCYLAGDIRANEQVTFVAWGEGGGGTHTLQKRLIYNG